MGLLWALEFETDMAADIYPAAMEEGLLLGLLGPNGIRLMPPLTVDEAEIDQAMERLDSAIAKASA